MRLGKHLAELLRKAADYGYTAEGLLERAADAEERAARSVRDIGGGFFSSTYCLRHERLSLAEARYCRQAATIMLKDPDWLNALFKKVGRWHYLRKA